MKKLFALSVLLLSFMSTNAQVPNPGFEIGNTQNNFPAQWGPSGYIVMPIDSNCYWTDQDSMQFWSYDAHSGQRSFELRVATYCTTGYTGTLQTRMFSIDTFADMRIPFTDTPDVFTFYYKFNAVGGDVLIAHAYLEMSDGSQVAYGEITLSQSAPGWIVGTLPLTYYESFHPEFMKMDFHLHNDTNLHYGTRFVIDDFDMVTTTSVAVIAKDHNALTCYPVPAQDILNIALPPATGEGSLSVFDALGRQVMAQYVPAHTSGTRINIGNLSPGIYSVKLSTATGVSSGRFLK